MSKFSQEVEVAFKVTESQEECEKLLVEGGYELIGRNQTHDLYFTNQELSKEMTEQELKFACVRFRHSGGRCG